MFGEKKQDFKKDIHEVITSDERFSEKTLDKSKNDDSDSGEFVKEKTKEKTLGRGGVKVL